MWLAQASWCKPQWSRCKATLWKKTAAWWTWAAYLLTRLNQTGKLSRKRTSTNFPRWTYAASKGAINILTKNMALDLAKYRIRVNSVSPGWIWSPEVAKVIFKTTLTTQCERIQNRWYKSCCSQIIPVSTPRQLQMGVAIIGNPLGANSTSAAGFCNTSLTVIYDNILILF